MSIQELSRLIRKSQCPSHFQLIPLPVELLLTMMRYLGPLDLMRFVLANYEDLVTHLIAPQLTEETVQVLQSACSDD